MTALGAVPSADAVRHGYITAILAGDRFRAFDVLEQARGAGLGLRPIYLGVLQPALREIGRLWQENEITVADEHLATAITQGAMSRLFGQVYAWGTRANRTLIAACADLERHEVGLRMICDLLEIEGWDTVYLGAAVPADSLAFMVERKRPDAVALSATITPHVPRLRSMIDALRALDEPPFIVVGGRPFHADPGLAERIGADLTADDAAEAVDRLTSRFVPR